MKKRYITAAICVAAALILGLCTAAQADQQRLSSKIIRLHVVAASDTAGDQAVKLQVRDAVLRETSAALQDAQDAVRALYAVLPEIERAANRTLQASGSKDTARVTLRRELFPTREYDTFRLPAGVYRSLRVSIGEAAGQNWWCVVFPALCLSAGAEELEAQAAGAGFTPEELQLITGEDEGIELEFKTLELLGKLKEFLWDA